MFKKKENDFKSLNRALLALALSMLIVSVYFLFSNHLEDYLYAGTTLKNSDAIGEILSYENDIRVKQQKSLLWKKVNRATPLQSGDGVFTGHDSQTKVRLKDGDIIDVQQNTMVVFAKTRGKQVANLLQGTFKVSVQKSLKIKIQGKETEITGNNSKLEITVDKDNAPVVKVIEGTAAISDNEKTVELAENQTVELEKPTEEEKMEVPPQEQIAVLPPEPHIWSANQASQLILTGDEKLILFYDPKNHLEQTLLEFSKDSEFNNSTVKAKWHPNNGKIITSIVEPGIYFLRLQSIDSSTNLASVSENMVVTITRPVVPAAPIPIAKEITLEQEEKVTLEWAPSENAVAYQITTRNTNGEEKVYTTDQRRFEWTAEEAGPQFFTLKAIDAHKRISPNTERIKILVTPKSLTMDRQIALSEGEIRYEVDTVSSYKNKSYTKSFAEIEGATATIFSKEELQKGNKNGALATLVGVRVRHWVDFNYGYEAYFRTKLVSVNSDSGQPAPLELEGRFNLRTQTDFNPFSSLRKSQMKFFSGLHIYQNNGSGDYATKYQLLKFGGGFLFPIGSQFETSGEAYIGFGIDQSMRYEASGQFLWYLLNDYSAGVGYRAYMFEGGSTSSPKGVPYREGGVEILFLMRYRY